MGTGKKSKKILTTAVLVAVVGSTMALTGCGESSQQKVINSVNRSRGESMLKYDIKEINEDYQKRLKYESPALAKAVRDERIANTKAKAYGLMGDRDKEEEFMNLEQKYSEKMSELMSQNDSSQHKIKGSSL
jgi:hypothetical protein